MVQLDLIGAPTMSPVPNSDWLALNLTFFGDPRILYLNLSANGIWALQNVPVQSIFGDYNPQTMTYHFGAGLQPGQKLEMLGFGVSLTHNVLESPPPETTSTVVQHDEIIFISGEIGSEVSFARAQPLVGGPAAPLPGENKPTKHVNDDGFPNQEADTNACAPVAFSNSLQWLNAKHNLGLKAGDIDIAAMKQATGFQPGVGSPADSYQGKAKATAGLGIETTVSKNPDDAANALDKDCDVELDVNGHVAAVVGIMKLASGKYAIDVAHDTKQGVMGGTKTETTIFDPATNSLSGGTFLDGTKLDQFVIECPKKPIAQ